MARPVKLSREAARWLLASAERGRAQTEEILDRHFNRLPVERRVRLQLALADFEWTIEQVMEVIRGHQARH